MRTTRVVRRVDALVAAYDRDAHPTLTIERVPAAWPVLVVPQHDDAIAVVVVPAGQRTGVADRPRAVNDRHPARPVPGVAAARTVPVLHNRHPPRAIVVVVVAIQSAHVIVTLDPPNLDRFLVVAASGQKAANTRGQRCEQ